MGLRRTDAPEPPNARSAPTIAHRAQLFTIEWFPILATLALEAAILVMIYQAVV